MAMPLFLSCHGPGNPMYHEARSTMWEESRRITNQERRGVSGGLEFLKRNEQKKKKKCKARCRRCVSLTPDECCVPCCLSMMLRERKPLVFFFSTTYKIATSTFFAVCRRRFCQGRGRSLGNPEQMIGLSWRAGLQAPESSLSFGWPFSLFLSLPPKVLLQGTLASGTLFFSCVPVDGSTLLSWESPFIFYSLSVSPSTPCLIWGLVRRFHFAELTGH